mgnify:CR=1 FL=1
MYMDPRQFVAPNRGESWSTSLTAGGGTTVTVCFSAGAMTLDSPRQTSLPSWFFTLSPMVTHGFLGCLSVTVNPMVRVSPRKMGARNSKVFLLISFYFFLFLLISYYSLLFLLICSYFFVFLLICSHFFLGCMGVACCCCNCCCCCCSYSSFISSYFVLFLLICSYFFLFLLRV